MTLTIENVELENGAVVRARKGRNAAHVMRAVPSMLGTFGITGVCGRNVGTSGDTDVTIAVHIDGKTCGRCDKIISELLTETETAQQENGTDTRDDSAPGSAPTLPGMDETTGVAGLTHAEMRAQVEAYYAAGHPVPAEVAALPDPAVRKGQWSGTDAGDAGAVTPCDYKGDVEIINPERTHGKCPECRAYIALQDVKSDPDAQRIGKHNRYGLATPARKGLSSKSVDTVEHGTIPGDPAAADKRRAAESRCVKSNKIAKDVESGGTIPCPECDKPVELIKKIRQTKKGEVVKWIVSVHSRPMAEDNTVDSFRASAGEGGYVHSERKVTPCGKGADAGKGQRDHGSVDGAATTGSQNMAPVRPGGWVGKAGTMSLPATVRPGIDPGVSGDICPLCQAPKDIAHKGMSRAMRRRHSAKVGAYLKGREEAREAATAKEIAEGSRLTGAERRKSRKVASVGSFAEGNVGGTVSHEPRPEFTPKGERKPAPRKADKGTQEAARKGLARAARKASK
jgi:ssDNA-binding Zn-finger/Zn-ribbon topoisomerase 1